MDIVPDGFRLVLQDDGFTTELYEDGAWRAGSNVVTRPVDALAPQARTANGYTGTGDGFSWASELRALHGGAHVRTVLNVSRDSVLAPTMIFWLATLDSLDDRQAHTWRQTILRAPTVNAGGLGGNDLPAAYLYDQATGTETVVYWPPESFAWAERRFCEWHIREALRYRPDARYGLGLQPATPVATVILEPGTYRFEWWFTQRPKASVPSPWEAQRALIALVSPLLDRMPTHYAAALPWQKMAQGALDNLQREECWVTVEGVRGLRAYVRGSSAVGRDSAPGFELMTQLDVLYPLLVEARLTGRPAPDWLADRLLSTLPHFDRALHRFVANGFPPRPGDTFMDTWYFLENSLIKLPWVAHLTGSDDLKAMFGRALAGAQTMARQCSYIFPLFADAADWRMRGSLLNPSAGGLYAAGCILGWQLFNEVDWLDEAARALRTLYTLPPHMLTHEPQQLSFGAAASAYLARSGMYGDGWDTLAADLVRLSLRMGYWGRDAAVSLYDPRGMFQACASLCYPAYKENVETLLPWAELLSSDDLPAFDSALTRLMAAFANLARWHNHAFFDAHLPAELRRGPCSFIPYEDLATVEFPYTATLGKELYGAGEVLWSSLMFDALGQVEGNPADLLCLSLDVPTLDLKTLATEGRRFLVYNAAGEARHVRLQTPDGTREVTVDSEQVIRVTIPRA